jgi:hypothetical protein
VLEFNVPFPINALNARVDWLRLRIGVHQGEVMPKADDRLGGGVIIAARLDSLADPGGIVSSSRVKEDASGRMAVEVDDLGEPALKNIGAKITVFRVRQAGADRPRTSAGPGQDARSEPAPAQTARPSIAVAAFTNTSGDPSRRSSRTG